MLYKIKATRLKFKNVQQMQNKTMCYTCFNNPHSCV